MAPYAYRVVSDKLRLSARLWGFIIVRTAYDSGYDEKFLQALAVLDSWVKQCAYSGLSLTCPEVYDTDLSEARTRRVGDKIMKQYHKFILEDEDRFANASVECIGRQFLRYISDFGIPADEIWQRYPCYYDINLVMFNKAEIDRILAVPADWTYDLDGPGYMVCIDAWANLLSPDREPGSEDGTERMTVYFAMMEWGHMGDVCEGHGLKHWFKAREEPMIIYTTGEETTEDDEPTDRQEAAETSENYALNKKKRIDETSEDDAPARKRPKID